MSPLRRLVLASNNAGKLREFRRLLAPLAIEVVAQSELGIPEGDEPHVTFIENALAKARHASERAKLPALADDSACVRALSGAGGPGAQCGAIHGRTRNNAKLIAELAESPTARALRLRLALCMPTIPAHRRRRSGRQRHRCAPW
jgi:XTP/dITP diphosphohydrolase